MRIVGGRFRGRALAALGKGDPAARLRPTSDRVREAVFNMVEHRYGLAGRRVLDLFAGTGALGLEALSRGAAEAVFVENGAAGGALIRKNLATLGIIDTARLMRGDATRLGPAKSTFDLVFADPPYGQGLGQAALGAARDGGWLASDAVFVLEEGGEVPLPSGFRIDETRRYGDTVVTMGRVGPE